MTGDDSERRRRIEQLKDELRLRRPRPAPPDIQRAAERFRQLTSDPEWRRQQQQWQEANELLNEAARELEREEAQGAEQSESIPTPPSSESVTQTEPSASSGALTPSEPAAAPPISKADTDEAIRVVYREINREAKRDKKKVPNVNELGDLAKPKLDHLGITTTQKRRREIAMEDEFQEMRQPAGVRWPGKSDTPQS